MAAPAPGAGQALGALLDDAPMTPARYGYWLVASGGTLLDGFSVVALGISVPLLKRDMAVDPVLIGLIGAADIEGFTFCMSGPLEGVEDQGARMLTAIALLAACTPWRSMS